MTVSREATACSHLNLPELRDCYASTRSAVLHDKIRADVEAARGYGALEHVDDPLALGHMQRVPVYGYSVLVRLGICGK